MTHRGQLFRSICEFENELNVLNRRQPNFIVAGTAGLVCEATKRPQYVSADCGLKSMPR